MPTAQDEAVLQATLADLSNDSTFVKLIQEAPPRIVFDDPRVINNPRVVAAYWPDENLISFRTSRTDQEAVRHEFYHAAQRFYLGESYCDTHNCEVAAYEFEKMHPRTLRKTRSNVLFMMRPRYDALNDWWRYD